MVSLMSIFLVIIFINGFLYKQETQKAGEGRFKTAKNSFDAGEFEIKPVLKFKNEQDALEKIKAIALEYESLKGQWPYILVIGHATEHDVPHPEDNSNQARWERNWNFAGERAARVSRLLQDNLKPEDRDNLVVVSTGEFDKRDPAPDSLANARVEVVFSAEWKPKSGPSLK